MIKRKGSIIIDKLESEEYPFSVDFEGWNEGSACPCKDENDIKQQVDYIIKNKRDYDLEIIDKRCIQKTLC